VSLDAFDALVRMTLAGSVAILVVLLARRFLRQRFGAFVAYVAWTLVPATLVAMLLPAPTRPVTVLAALVHVAPLQTVAATAAPSAFDWRLALFTAWLAGALLAAAWFVQQQRRYLRSLGRLQPREGTRIVQSSSEFAGPALVGAWRPRIVLPSDFDGRYDARERELILAHEHVHFARGDAWINALVAALRSLNWFNPLIHHAAARFRIDQELACDAAVVARFPEARRQYADAMLKVQLAGQPRQELRLPVGCRWPSDKTLKERILMLKQSRPTRARRIAGLALVALLGLGGTYAAWATQAAPSPHAAAASASGTQWAVHLDIANGGSTLSSSSDMQIIAREGEPTEVRYGTDDDRRRVVVTVTTADAGMADVQFELYRRDKLESKPRLRVRDGEPAQIKVGKDGGAASGFDGFDLHVTVRRASLERPTQRTAVEKMRGDTDASYGSMTPPHYPNDAIKNKVQGRVWIKATIGADGTVRVASVERVEPESAAALGDSAVEAVKSWKFNPAMSKGYPVEGDVLIPIDFDLDDHHAAVTPPQHDARPVLDALTVSPPEKH